MEAIISLISGVSTNISDKVFLIQYEHLVVRPIEIIENTFNFCELHITDQVVNFIEESQIYEHIVNIPCHPDVAKIDTQDLVDLMSRFV